jgi:Ca-activated chloride channel family protein
MQLSLPPFMLEPKEVIRMSITLTARLDRPHIPPSGASVQLLIQLTAPSQPMSARPPLNLAAVIDRSGSMAGPKLDYTKQALRFLIDQVTEKDHLAIVTYDDVVQTPVPSQPIIQKDLLKAQVSQITPGGMTNLSGGLSTGMNQIAPHAAPGQINRVLLMTDGLANVGVTDSLTLQTWATTWRHRGLTLSTLGVGDDFDEDLLVALAEAGGGSFHYIADPDKIPAIFAAELQGLLQVAAQGLQLQIQAEPGVAIASVIGYPPVGTPGQVSLSLPDIYGGEVKSLLVTLHVAAPPHDGKLARISLAYLPTGAAPERLALEITAHVTTDPGLLSTEPDPEVTRQLTLARAAAAREEAIRLSDQGDLTSAADLLSQAAQDLAAFAAAGDVEAGEQVASLQARAEELRQNQYDKAARKRLRYESFQARQGRNGRP